MRAHVRVVVAVGLELLSAETLFKQPVPDQRGEGFDGRHIDELTYAGSLAMQQRHHGGVCRSGTDRRIPVAHAGPKRRPTAVADQRSESGQRRETGRVARLMT